VKQFIYLETNITNQNSIQEENKRRLNSGNSSYHCVQYFLTSRFLFKNLKIKTYRTIILPVVLYGCETWSLTLREERRLRVLRRLFGPKRDELIGVWRNLYRVIHKSLRDFRTRLRNNPDRHGRKEHINR